MQISFPELLGKLSQPGDASESLLLSVLTEHLSVLEHELVQDLTHISHFANYISGMTLDKVCYEKGNQYRLEYHYPWEMNWSCADQTGSGVIHDKVRFIVDATGRIEFKILKFNPE